MFCTTMRRAFTISIELRLFNHAELVYAPGERDLVKRLFEALGCRLVDSGGPYLVVLMDFDATSFYDNCLYVSEIVKEQLEFESILRKRLEAGNEIGDRHQKFIARFEREPQRTTHLGLRLPSDEELDEVLARLDSLGDALPGRVSVARVIRPGDAASLDAKLIQAFIRTDLCAAGLLCLGQHFELQVQL